MHERARSVRDSAHAPYSRFHVGACIEVEDGALFSGCNVENASYGATVCAERNAIFQAVANGHRQIRRVLVCTEGEPLAMPCALCLQVMSEFASPSLEVAVASPNSVERVLRFSELLPHPFAGIGVGGKVNAVSSRDKRRGANGRSNVGLKAQTRRRRPK